MKVALRWLRSIAASSVKLGRFAAAAPLAFQNDGVNVAAVVRLVAMDGAAVAVEALVGIGVDIEIVDHQDAGVFEPHPDEAGEIEHRMAVAGGGKEEHRVVGVGLDEADHEFGADLIALLADQGTDRGDRVFSLGAEFFHGVDGRFQDPGQRAPPAGMRRADHASVRIDQQDRSAIGRGDADRKPLGARDDGVGLRSRRALPRAGRDHRIRRMDLMHVEEILGRNAHLLSHPAAVFADISGIVAGAEPAIEAAIDAIGDAAVAGEEGVAKAWNGREQGRTEHHADPPAGFSSLSPGSIVSLGSDIPKTLNITPMPPRPPPISRLSALEMSSDTSWLAFAIKVTARVSMPSRCRKSPCVTGPCTRAPMSSAACASAWKSTCAVTSACPGACKGSVKL